MKQLFLVLGLYMFKVKHQKGGIVLYNTVAGVKHPWDTQQNINIGIWGVLSPILFRIETIMQPNVTQLFQF